MTAEHLCPDCRAAFQLDDNYCRQCGMYLAAMRAVTPLAPNGRAMEVVRPGLPAPVKKAATALAIGTALQIGVGLAGRYLASQATKQAAQAIRPKPRGRKGREVEPVRQAPADPRDNAGMISETLMIRRVWIRRHD